MAFCLELKSLLTELNIVYCWRLRITHAWHRHETNKSFLPVSQKSPSKLSEHVHIWFTSSSSQDPPFWQGEDWHLVTNSRKENTLAPNYEKTEGILSHLSLLIKQDIQVCPSIQSLLRAHSFCQYVGPSNLTCKEEWSFSLTQCLFTQRHFLYRHSKQLPVQPVPASSQLLPV